MNVTEQFSSLFEKGDKDQMLAFLKKLDASQRKSLVPLIKKLNKEYNESGALSGTRWGYIRGTDHQRHLLQLASFACFNRADFEKSPDSFSMLQKKNLDTVSNWCVPVWFSDFMNAQADQESLPYFIQYDQVMEMHEKGILQPSRELIAKTLINLIFDVNSNPVKYQPEKLLERPVTLREHIWYLFDVETNLHYADRFLHFGTDVDKDKIGWMPVLLANTAAGKIDRRRLLQEALLACNKNFNKVLSGWFAQLFASLKPTKDELLHLQKELFGVLGAKHSKCVSTALEAIKAIWKEKIFDTRGFLDSVPALLTSDTKAVVNTTLSILEKIATTSSHAAEIGLLATRAFINNDDVLQAKAAKLIVDTIPANDAAIADALRPYHEGMMSSARKIMAPFMAPVAAKSSSIPLSSNTGVLPANELIPIPPIESFDDLVFLASQLVSNNQPWHIATLPAALVEWEHKIGDHDLSKFEPALQSALKMIKSDVNAQQGRLDHLLATFFIDVCVHWVHKYALRAKTLADLFEKHKQVNGPEISRWTDIAEDNSYLLSWESHYRSIYVPHRRWLMAALEKIKNGDSLPMLATPTHEPCWIDPVVLVQRLSLYEANNSPTFDIDLQLAIARCYLKNVDKAISHAEKLSEENRNLLLFFFDKHTEPRGPFGYPPAWLVASVMKKEKRVYKAFAGLPWYDQPFERYSGQYKWESVDEEFETVEYKGGGITVPVTRRRKILRVLTNREAPVSSWKIDTTVNKSGDEETMFIIHDNLVLNVIYVTTEHNDSHRVVHLLPNNPEPLLADVINSSLRNLTFWNEPDKRYVIGTLRGLYEIWDRFGTIAHVFVASCMVSSDKTAANLAAEIWIKGVTANTIESGQMGEVIGKHLRIEFVPLKRFTDLAMQRLFRISEKHNQALQVMVENILLQLPESPVTNLKKLLELYLEVSEANNTQVADDAIKTKMRTWGNTAALKKLAAAILANKDK